MRYELFTYPNCSHCNEMRAKLTGNGLEGTEYDLSSREGATEIRKIYPKIRDKVQRDTNGIKTPLVLLRDNEEIVAVVQDKEGLVACLSKA